MSSQEQNDRHIIWSDISLDLDDWRESLEELYPGCICSVLEKRLSV